MIIIMNEVKAAENCLKNGLIDGKPLYTLAILTKYYYHHCGFKPKKIRELLLEYLKKWYPRYEYSEFWWEESIEKLARKAKHTVPCEIDEIPITQKELDKIATLENKQMERLLFTMLCLGKLNHMKNPLNNYWVNYKPRYFYKMARVNCTVDDRFFRLGILGRMELIEVPKHLLTNIRVTFVDESEDSKVVLRVHQDDLSELGYVYRQYKGEKFSRCEKCNRLIRQNKNGTKKYCKDCIDAKPLDYKFVQCEVCGEWFRTSNLDNRAYRCPDCQYKERYNIKGKRIIKCVDCGKEFEATTSKRDRCDECYAIYRKKKKAESMRKAREKQKVN